MGKRRNKIKLRTFILWRRDKRGVGVGVGGVLT